MTVSILTDRVVKICRTCNKLFSISNEELKWLEARGLAEFEHCSVCRKNRREHNAR